jgi:septum formation protein
MSKFLQQTPIILASGSINRQQLLKDVGLEFDIQLSHVDEDAIKAVFEGDDWEALALQLAEQKAMVVTKDNTNHTIIAADQLCVLNHRIYDKPLTHERAVHQLSQLNGHTHQLLTAVCLAQDGQVIWRHVEPINLTMRPLTQEAIEHYVSTAKPLNSCGSYHYESMGQWLFESVSGQESTIVGLSMMALLNALIQFNIVTI